MKPMIKGMCASALALSMAISGVVPGIAAPLRASVSQIDQSNIIQVQSRHERRQERRELRRERREFRHERRQDRREARRERREDRRHARFERRHGHYYYNGHRGYRTYHRGYREYNGYWFPPAAFIAGAIIGGAMASSGTRTVSSAHVNWCQNRYRSYRISDDTFQPYNGPRQRCHSPYD